jgi:RNA ligase
MIEKVSDIQSLLLEGFTSWKELGHVSTARKGDLIIFNYNAQAQFEARWNYLERVSRGLILNVLTGEVIARPFDKFFNWGEGDRYSNAPIVTVTEKLDGSLGILYREGKEYKIATRGSFDSEQALWATEFLNSHYELTAIPKSLTLLFEIIYPGNRVVVDYQGREDLVLLAGRWTITGEYVPFDQIQNLALVHGFSLPKVYQFNTPEQIIEACQSLESNSEGWVVEFLDGQRFKFKGEEYRKLHKLISGLSFKNTLECCASGTLDELRAIVPDEFMGEVNCWIEQIQATVESTRLQIEAAFREAPKQSRKDFALWVNEHHRPIASYLFARLDDRPIEPLIYKLAFRNDDQ